MKETLQGISNGKSAMGPDEVTVNMIKAGRPVGVHRLYSFELCI